MIVRLLAAASLELDDALAWYGSQSPVLERRFLEEIGKGRARIAEYPNAWHPLGEGVRQFRLERFPYGLIYVITASEIVVMAVAHLHREPGYWRDRIPKA